MFQVNFKPALKPISFKNLTLNFPNFLLNQSQARFETENLSILGGVWGEVKNYIALSIHIPSVVKCSVSSKEFSCIHVSSKKGLNLSEHFEKEERKLCINHPPKR